MSLKPTPEPQIRLLNLMKIIVEAQWTIDENVYLDMIGMNVYLGMIGMNVYLDIHKGTIGMNVYLDIHKGCAATITI